MFQKSENKKDFSDCFGLLQLTESRRALSVSKTQVITVDKARVIENFTGRQMRAVTVKGCVREPLKRLARFMQTYSTIQTLFEV